MQRAIGPLTVEREDHGPRERRICRELALRPPSSKIRAATMTASGGATRARSSALPTPSAIATSQAARAQLRGERAKRVEVRLHDQNRARHQSVSLKSVASDNLRSTKSTSNGTEACTARTTLPSVRPKST